MFARFIEKFNDFADHHQVFIALVIGLSVICVSWGVEKILEQYICKNKTFFSYLILVMSGLIFLWLVKHFILHVV